VNASLDERIGSMREQLDQVQEAIVANRKKITHLHLVINNFKVCARACVCVGVIRAM
jgi:hypothetical protein